MKIFNNNLATPRADIFTDETFLLYAIYAHHQLWSLDEIKIDKHKNKLILCVEIKQKQKQLEGHSTPVHAG